MSCIFEKMKCVGDYCMEAQIKIADLTTEQIFAFLNEKFSNTKCSLCGETSFGVHSGVVFNLHATRRESLDVTGYSMPLAAVECRSCGNTYLINALTVEEQIKGVGRDEQ